MLSADWRVRGDLVAAALRDQHVPVRAAPHQQAQGEAGPSPSAYRRALMFRRSVTKGVHRSVGLTIALIGGRMNGPVALW